MRRSGASYTHDFGTCNIGDLFCCEEHVAVLIDATLIRAVLLPASMKLLGDWNWYLPRWLEWLPTLAHEDAETVDAAPELSLAA